MRIFIDPLDVLFFRDGKPFTAGESHLATCLFPPSPMTFQGAIRSKILAEQNIDFGSYANYDRKSSEMLKSIVDEIGTPNNYGRIRLQGPFLAKKDGEDIVEYFPVPQDLVVPRGNGSKEILQLQLLKEATFDSDYPVMNYSNFLPLWAKTRHRIETAQGFLSSDQFGVYLKGETPTSVVSEIDLVKREHRAGLKHEVEARVVEEGMLYSAEFIRLKPGIGFVLNIENTTLLPDSGILSLGGEQRAASYQKVNAFDFDYEDVKKAVEETKRFKLYLAAPAFFNQGWLPDFINDKSCEAKVGDLKFKLISAAIGKTMPLGGWDLATNKPKGMKRAVPPGSVYFFELIEGEVEKLFDRFWFNSISSEHGEVGFGITFIGGGWDYV